MLKLEVRCKSFW